MKYNFPLVNNNNNSIFQKTNFNPFYPKAIHLYNNNPNFINVYPFQKYCICNKYQNLYSQIISHEKTITLNTVENKRPNPIEYKPFVSDIKIIFNEDSNNQKDIKNVDNNEDKTNNFLGNKRMKEKIYEKNKINITNDENLIKKSLRGRKKKIESIKGNHTKFTSDNIIRKIKTHFFNHINETLNESLVNKKLSFLKLDNFNNENLKKDYNMKLMNLTIKDIYLTSKISNKYRKHGSDINKNLIQKIYSEKNENEVIKILDRTFIEIYNDLMKYDLDNFCYEILEKEEKNGLSKSESIEYLKEIKYLCQNYENWFKSKKGRQKKQKEKEQKVPEKDLEKKEDN